MLMLHVVRGLFALTLLSSLVVSQENNAVDVNGDVYCLTVHEDLLRRQSDEWGSADPYTVVNGTKHTPYLSFDAATRQATILVGNGYEEGGVFHPMVASDDPTVVHFIMYIYVQDQNNDTFAFATLDPNQPAPATFVFDVPEAVTQLVPFEFW